MLIRAYHDENDQNGFNEVKFAYNMLEKLLEYCEKASINMQSLKESARFSRKGSFKMSGQDVKFFTKVNISLPFIRSKLKLILLKSIARLSCH